MNASLQDLQRLIRALQRFNQFDTKMQVSTMLVLLEVAEATLSSSDISNSDLEKKIGLQSGTSSRNVYYWADGHPDVRGAHKMVTVRINAEDRRKRDLSLNAKGRTFVNTVLDDFRGTSSRS
ncbi:MAG: hypothetical protein KUL88_00020 [Rhizobium sp.]|nr:hypothetical protein [Rhizobium sp.]